MASSRRLAVIMFSDIVGYTKLMGRDEALALSVLKKNKGIHQRLLKSYRGNLLKEMGDGMLCSFDTVSDAVFCAEELLRETEDLKNLDLRIGIHLGETVEEGAELYGDGINIASRLQSIAASGQLLVSDIIYKNIRNKPGVQATFLGEKNLKNVDEPLRVYDIRIKHLEKLFAQIKSSKQGRTKQTKLLPIITVILTILLGYFGIRYFGSTADLDQQGNERFIAVLPFTNMSNDPEQEYFSDGISEELLNGLARIPDLRVIGRTSSWTYKGVSDKTLREIGEELGVGSILQGSVRKSGNNIRINAQLIDTENESHVWNDSYDREWTDIFILYDQITSSIITALKLHFEEDRAKSEAATSSMEAYAKYLQARQRLAARGSESLLEAKRLFEETIELDSDFDLAYSGLGRVLQLLPWFPTDLVTSDLFEQAKAAANRALELNPENAEAFSVLGVVTFSYDWDWRLADGYFNRSLLLDAGSAEPYNFIGDYYQTARHPQALEMELTALELDPLHAVNHYDLSRLYASKRDWENTLRYAESARSLGVHYSGVNSLLVRSYFKLGRFNEAENIVTELDSAGRNSYSDMETKAILAVLKKDYAAADSCIDLMLKDTDQFGDIYSRIANRFLEMERFDEAAFWLEKAHENREFGIFFIGDYAIPEELPDHPALQASFDKPDLQQFFDIRRENMGLK